MKSKLGCFLAVTLPAIGIAATLTPPYPAILWSGFPSLYTTEQYLSIAFPDVNGDGKSDLCYRNNTGLSCAVSDGNQFAALVPWSTDFWTGLASPWSRQDYFWRTLQYADVNGDGKADICGQVDWPASGIYCAISTGSSFLPRTRWSADFPNLSGGWGDIAYWKTIRFVDLNHDGKADICARGANGIICAISNGSGFNPTTLWTSHFSNAQGWNRDWAYWSTIQYADINGDGLADVCGRAIAGLECAVGDGVGQFRNVAVWTNQYSDSAGWNAPEYYSTIRLADVDGDGKADVCGRGIAGFYCGHSTGSSFVGTDSVQAPDFSDANGWNRGQHYSDLWLGDVNGDGRADICGRGYDGIYCAFSLYTGVIRFGAARIWVTKFGTVATSPDYSLNYPPNIVIPVKPTHHIPGINTGFCGLETEIFCSYYPVAARL